MNLTIDYNLIIYFFVFIIICYLFICAFIRIKMRFWYSQPVFHIYNLAYWINPPGFINKSPPPVNKFVNLVNNKLITIDTVVDDVNIKKICNFIKDYYLLHPSAKYSPSYEDITAYLHCNNYPSFFNVYKEPILLFENGLPSDKFDEEIIGVASAHTLNITINNKNKKKIEFPAYYVDHLCVKPAYRKKNITPQMIQTFYYNVSRTVPKVNAYLFKREGELNAIVSLTVYDTYYFDITNFVDTRLQNKNLNIIQIGKQHLNLLIKFIQDQMIKFECVILPDISSIINLIQLEKLIIYGLIDNGELVAIYVFRTLELYYGEKKAVECISIVSKCKLKELTLGGFIIGLAKIKTKLKTNIIMIENTAHSTDIITALYNNPIILFMYKSPTAFFLYNYANYTIKNNKALLIY